jgi:hypothetical protein
VEDACVVAPWSELKSVTNDDGTTALHPSGLIALVYGCPDPGRSYDGAAANTALIAAAPDLLNGCRALLGLLQLVICRDDISPELQNVLRGNHRIAEAEAALAKATEPQPEGASND